ncbi:MAG: ABC transporter substrate-binding protein [Treponema sp.]|jgi:arabinosaccharide transport system substrate-binding protein|nr:ABC transporter substrate-binding protein [Treponema sp.]
MKRIFLTALILIAGTGTVFAGGRAQSGAAGGSGNVILWAFAEPHARYFEWVGAEYKKTHPDFNLQVELMTAEAENDRLSVIIMSNGEGSPDLVDIEQGQFPRYMSADKICFEPLNTWIQRDGINDKVVASRQNLYLYNGNYYGIEHALTPATMAYRKDLFERYGIKVPTTWAEYKDAAAKFKQYGISIMAIGDMRRGLPDELELFLRSANADYVNTRGELNITPAYRQIVSDFKTMQQEGMIYPFETDEERWLGMRQDKVVTYITPDWAAGWLRDNVPEQSGKWAMAPMPKFDANSSRTSCRGGTGLAIMKYTKKDKESLWDFVKFAQTDTDNAVQKFKMINLFPVVYDAMSRCGGPVEYYGGQDLGTLYQELAREMPVQNQASWRGIWIDTMASNAYDFYEGNITLDQYLNLGAEAIKNR